MKHIASFSDQHYLIKGLSMYESLLRHSTDFTLHYLCLDQKTYDIMYNLPYVKAYQSTDLNPQDFYTTKENFTEHINDLSWFHFALTPLFTHHILSTQNIPVMYIDADILLYNDIQLLFNSVKYNSIGLMTHKHISPNEKTAVGYYNVGIVYFNNDIIGNKACKWWKETTINKNNPYYQTHGTCGDQKYLELFNILFGVMNIKILDEDIGHAAPWNRGLCIDINLNTITWQSHNVLNISQITQPMVAYHFSHFTPNYNENTYRVDRGGEWGDVTSDPKFKKLYDDYFKQTKTIKEKYKL